MIEPDSYCREIEAYLCRKNDGHLIRISGPAFDQVTGWAREGIPIKVACAGIDRYFERYYRKGPRRRPIRIEFCEADVFDAFDAWRRAVGVTLPAAGSEAADGSNSAHVEPDLPGRKRGSLGSHIERVLARLTTLRASSQVAYALRDVLERVTRELDGLQSEARSARGEAREALLAQLRGLDRALLSSVMATLDNSVRVAAEAEAREALAPFRERMAPDAYQAACTAAMERHVREHFGLPAIPFD